MASCELPAPLTAAGANFAVPIEPGSPETDRATLPVKPLSAPMEAVYVAVAPAETVRELGVTLRLKSGGAATTRVTGPECEIDPLVPVTVSGYDPGAAVADVLMASCDVPASVTTAGVSDALPTEAGRPVTVNATSPVKPLSAPTVTL